jgi:hypothetical protein
MRQRMWTRVAVARSTLLVLVIKDRHRRPGGVLGIVDRGSKWLRQTSPAVSSHNPRLGELDQSSSWSSKSGHAAMSTPWLSGDASVHHLGACESAMRPPAASAAATRASA